MIGGHGRERCRRDSAGDEILRPGPAPVVAVLVATLEIGGAERAALRLAEGLLAQGFAVDVVVVRATGPLRAELPARTTLVDLGCSRVSLAIPALAVYLRRRRPDAVIAQVTHICLMALLAAELSGVATRVVVREQSSISRISAASHLRRDRWAPYLVRHLYPRAHSVVAVSQGAADALAEVCPWVADRIHVIPSPVVTPALRTQAAEPLTHLWFRPGQPPVLVAVGRLVPEKGFDILIRAFAGLRRHRPARLLVIGEGRDRPALEDLARELGVAPDVDLAGQCPNPYPYLAGAAVVVASSRVEGLTTVLIEALALGAIVVATDCDSGPREILADGRFGTLVPVGDDRALADALDTALDTALDDTALDDTASSGDHERAVPDEAWQPYERDVVTARYVDLLGLARPGAPIASPPAAPQGPPLRRPGRLFRPRLRLRSMTARQRSS